MHGNRGPAQGERLPRWRMASSPCVSEAAAALTSIPASIMASTSACALKGAQGVLQKQHEGLATLIGRRQGRRLPAQRQRSGARTLLRVEAVAAPEKPTVEEFRAWTSPSARKVAKRDDLKT